MDSMLVSKIIYNKINFVLNIFILLQPTIQNSPDSVESTWNMVKASLLNFLQNCMSWKKIGE